MRAGKCDKGAAGDPLSLFMKTSYVIKGYTLGADASDKLVSEQIDQFSRTHARTRAHTHTHTDTELTTRDYIRSERIKRKNVSETSTYKHNETK